MLTDMLSQLSEGQGRSHSIDGTVFFQSEVLETRVSEIEAGR